MRIWLSVLILGALGGCTPAAVRTRAPEALPALTFERLDGTRATIADLAGGRPALVSLWATWCEACRSEFAPIERLWRRADHDALIVAVAEGESTSTVKAFVNQERLPYPQLVDEPYALGDALAERRVPTTLVVDRAGTIVHRGGLFDSAALAALRAELER